MVFRDQHDIVPLCVQSMPLWSLPAPFEGRQFPMYRLVVLLRIGILLYCLAIGQGSLFSLNVLAQHADFLQIPQ